MVTDSIKQILNLCRDWQRIFFLTVEYPLKLIHRHIVEGIGEMCSFVENRNKLTYIQIHHLPAKRIDFHLTSIPLTVKREWPIEYLYPVEKAIPDPTHDVKLPRQICQSNFCTVSWLKWLNYSILKMKWYQVFVNIHLIFIHLTV